MEPAGSSTDADVVDPAFSELVERLVREADEGFFHRGAQLVVLRGDETLVDVAVGHGHLGTPLTGSTVHALYCTAKPVLAVAVLRLVAEDELSLDDRLGDVVEVDLPRWMQERTVEQVLGHTAGLHEPPSVWSRIIPESERLDWLRTYEPPPGWRFGIDRSYSEWAGWYVLGLAVEGLTGEGFDTYAARAVTGPYGVPDDDLALRLVGEQADRVLARTSATVDLAGPRPVPLLAEVGRDTAGEWNPAFGAYGTMRALARFYRGLLDDLAGAGRVLPQPLVGEMTRSRLPLTDDRTLGRPVAFGLGVMTTLSSHQFGDRVGGRTFGHAGQGGSSFAFADPDRDAVVALLCNAGLDAETALGFRRVSLADALCRALDAA